MDASIIIRTKNEEDWIKPCLQQIRKQKFKGSYEVILVDNMSKDATVKIAKEYGVKKILKIKNFIPGKAINEGIKKSLGKKLIIISAHCIPKSNLWLSKLYNSLSDKKIAGVYGRQLPLPFTSSDDTRDLLYTFGNEQRIQKKDSFFHNAHSIIWRSVWKKHNFCEEAKNIEDRIWGEEVIKNGFFIKYFPKAEVYHHHGLHQHGSKESFRAKNVSNLTKTIMKEDSSEIPFVLTCQNKNVPIVVPVKRKIKNLTNFNNFIANIMSQNDDDVFVMSFEKIRGLPKGAHYIKRNISISANIDKFLLESLKKIERWYGSTIDGLSVFDYSYTFPILEAPKMCKALMFQENRKFVGYAYEDYGTHWSYFSGNLKPISFFNKEKKDPSYRLAFGQGSTFRASSIRQKNLIPDNSSIIKSKDIKILVRD